MDNIITERPEITIDDQELMHSSPGHVSQQDALPPEGEAPKRRAGKNRSKLLVGGSFTVVALAAAGVFAISPYNHLTVAGAGQGVAHARQVALQGFPGLSDPSPMAPNARLARAPEPSHAAALPSHPLLDGGNDMDQFLKLGNHAPLAPERSHEVTSAAPAGPRQEPRLEIASPVKPSAAPVPQEVGMADSVPAPNVQQAPITPVAPATAATAAAVQAAALPAQPATVAAVPVPVPAPDAAQALTQLHPAPLTPQDQVDVLQLVTQLGALVRDQRLELDALRKAQAGLQQTVDTSIGDFRRRLTLAEARGSIAAAMGAPTQAAAADTLSDGKLASQPTVPIVQAAARTVIRTAAADDTIQHRYRIQAASPGLAMLSELDSTGTGERQLTIQPGDELPGYGRVASVSQRGTAWIVKAERGLIQ